MYVLQEAAEQIPVNPFQIDSRNSASRIPFTAHYGCLILRKHDNRKRENSYDDFET
jgi:hypothetical protein